LTKQNQIGYYDDFFATHESSILTSPDPTIWTRGESTSDTGNAAREAMKQRVALQMDLCKSHLHSQSSTLDIGCGYGRQTVLLAELGLSVTGIDTSRAGISIAERLFSARSLPGNFLVGGIDQLPPNERYRNIVLFDVLEHVPCRARGSFVESVYRHIEPRGRVVVSVPWRPFLKMRLGNVARMLGLGLDKEHPFVLPSQSRVASLFANRFREIHRCHSKSSSFQVFEESSKN
jgi:2-polyprenyl-3-methyl-5-hydroxy-6-metoxy-1,4-benzoquinol methylase